MDDFKHTFVEENKLVQESNSKFYKRLIVGLIRYFSDDDGNLNIPEEFFSDVPDNLGFKTATKHMSDAFGNNDDIRTLTITNEWKYGVDDDGGNEMDIENVSYSKPENTKIFPLSLVVDNTKNDTKI